MKKYYLYDIPVFLILLVFWTWLYLTYFYSYIALVFYGNWPQDDWLVPSVLILGLTGLSFLFARSLYTKRLSRRLIQGTYALYFILLFLSSFSKISACRALIWTSCPLAITGLMGTSWSRP